VKLGPAFLFNSRPQQLGRSFKIRSSSSNTPAQGAINTSSAARAPQHSRLRTAPQHSTSPGRTPLISPYAKDNDVDHNRNLPGLAVGVLARKGELAAEELVVGVGGDEGLHERGTQHRSAKAQSDHRTRGR